MKKFILNKIFEKKESFLKRKGFLTASLFFSILFLVFSFLVHKGSLAYLDYRIISGLQMIPRAWDVFLSFFSLIGSFEVYSLFLLAVFLYLRKYIEFLIVYGIFGALHIIEILGKYFIFQPPPPHEFFRFSLPFVFPSSGVKPGYAYPSGHSMRTVFISILLGYLVYKNKKLSNTTKMAALVLILVFDFVMLASRVSLGEHWFTDVVGGAFLALAGVFFALLFI